MSTSVIPIDILIFGGGVAGLWTLDELLRHGFDAFLVETRALGQGQTIASQGIIHGGLKYLFAGNLTSPVKAILEMPLIWRQCLEGTRQPNLSATAIRSPYCYIWGTGSLKSKIFLTGSTLALRAAPEPVERANWPAALSGVSGKVLRVPEQVIDPASMVGALAFRNRKRILHIDAAQVDFAMGADGKVLEVRVCPPAQPQETAAFAPKLVVFAAGEGNAGLREKVGLAPSIMQRRPLHMVMARGKLLALFGHCVGGPRPRVTITGTADSKGRSIWQVGGQIAEDGVKMERRQLVDHARRELSECVPGMSFEEVELSTYRIDRAEAATATGQIPDDVHLVREGNVITAWPTKLALAPRLAQRVIEEISQQKDGAPETDDDRLANWPQPPIALAPWEQESEWTAAR
jgi:glycerol-3-phosphate dehydrogenase